MRCYVASRRAIKSGAREKDLEKQGLILPSGRAGRHPGPWERSFNKIKNKRSRKTAKQS